MIILYLSNRRKWNKLQPGRQRQAGLAAAPLRDHPHYLDSCLRALWSARHLCRRERRPRADDWKQSSHSLEVLQSDIQRQSSPDCPHVPLRLQSRLHPHSAHWHVGLCLFANAIPHGHTFLSEEPDAGHCTYLFLLLSLFSDFATFPDWRNRGRPRRRLCYHSWQCSAAEAGRRPTRPTDQSSLPSATTSVITSGQCISV